MKVLIAYDVGTTTPAGGKRLRQVARACKDYGVRVQKSVFECTVGDADWLRLRARLLGLMNSTTDSLRFYFLESNHRVEHRGAAEPPNLDDVLIV